MDDLTMHHRLVMRYRLVLHHSLMSHCLVCVNWNSRNMVHCLVMRRFMDGYSSVVVYRDDLFISCRHIFTFVMHWCVWVCCNNDGAVVSGDSGLMVHRRLLDYHWVIPLSDQLLIKLLRHLHILANFLSFWLMVLGFWLLVVRSWNFNVPDFSSWLCLSIPILCCRLAGYLNVSRSVRRRLLVSCVMGGLGLHIVRLVDDIARSWLGCNVATLLDILGLGLDVGRSTVEGGLVGDLRSCGKVGRSGQVVPVISLLRVS